jgi:DNA polymerase III alpha subunit (gram-positive type)
MVQLNNDENITMDGYNEDEMLEIIFDLTAQSNQQNRLIEQLIQHINKLQNNHTINNNFNNQNINKASSQHVRHYLSEMKQLTDNINILLVPENSVQNSNKTVSITVDTNTTNSEELTQAISQNKTIQRLKDKIEYQVETLSNKLLQPALLCFSCDRVLPHHSYPAHSQRCQARKAKKEAKKIDKAIEKELIKQFNSADAEEAQEAVRLKAENAKVLKKLQEQRDADFARKLAAHSPQIFPCIRNNQFIDSLDNSGQNNNLHLAPKSNAGAIMVEKKNKTAREDEECFVSVAPTPPSKPIIRHNRFELLGEEELNISKPKPKNSKKTAAKTEINNASAAVRTEEPHLINFQGENEPSKDKSRSDHDVECLDRAEKYSNKPHNRQCGAMKAAFWASQPLITGRSAH